jgi:hypothetical protein
LSSRRAVFAAAVFSKVTEADWASLPEGFTLIDWILPQKLKKDLISVSRGLDNCQKVYTMGLTILAGLGANIVDVDSAGHFERLMYMAWFVNVRAVESR